MKANLGGGETPINNSITLYDALKKEVPEFIEEIEQKVRVHRGRGLGKVLSWLRVSNTNSTVPAHREKTRRQQEHPFFNHMARMSSIRTRLKRQGRR